MLPWTVVWTESRSNIPNTVRHILVPCSCFFPLKTRNTKRLLLKLTQHLVAVPLRHAAFFVGGARLTLVRPQLSYGRSFSHGMGRRWCCQQSNWWAKTDHVNITSTSKKTANPRREFPALGWVVNFFWHQKHGEALRKVSRKPATKGHVATNRKGTHFFLRFNVQYAFPP